MMHVSQYGRDQGLLSLQALLDNVDLHKSQFAEARRRSGPAMLRRCLRVWRSQTQETTAWVKLQAGSLRRRRGFLAWVQYMKVISPGLL